MSGEPTMTSLYDVLRERLRTQLPTALATVVDGPHPGRKLLVTPDEVIGGLGHPELDRIVARDTLAELEAGRSGIRHYGPEGQTTPEDLVDTPIVSVFVESWAPPPQMWIFGAVDFTAALVASVAKVLGYRVIGVRRARSLRDPPPIPHAADEVVVSWPGRSVRPARHPRSASATPCAILTHDPKFDVPAVQGALATRVGYIGVMGSRKTHAKRMERLREVGVTDPVDLDRLMSPIGLDLGARTPEETAISICAEIIARRTGRMAPSLRATPTVRSTADEKGAAEGRRAADQRFSRWGHRSSGCGSPSRRRPRPDGRASRRARRHDRRRATA